MALRITEDHKGLMDKWKTYIVEGKSERISEILKDLESYGRLHPLIRKVEKLDLSDKGQSYRVWERPFGWIPVNIQYVALVKTGIDSLDYEISGIPLTKAYINYKLLSKSENLTEIQFYLKISSRAIGRNLLMKKMIDAQDRLMNAIQVEVVKGI